MPKSSESSELQVGRVEPIITDSRLSISVPVTPTDRDRWWQTFTAALTGELASETEASSYLDEAAVSRAAGLADMALEEARQRGRL